MISDIKAKISPFAPDVYSGSGTDFLTQSKIGQLFTAGWKERFLLAGRVFQAPLGTVGATSHTGLIGNTAVDLDQPEFLLGVDSGILIPLEIDINILVDDFNAYDDIIQFAFWGDRSQGLNATDEALGNAITVLNLLDGGDAFSGRATETVGTDITDPVHSDYLGGHFIENTQLAAEVAGTVPPSFNFHKEFTAGVHHLLRGPASIVGYVTGTNAPTYQGHVTFAHLPTTWIPTS